MQNGSDEMAADALVDFYVLAADGNRSRHVNLADFNILAANYGQTGRTFSQGNYNYDPQGIVNDFDVQQSTDGQTFDVYYNRPAGGGAIQEFVVPNLLDGKRYWFRVRAYSDSATNPNGPNTAYTPKRGATTVMRAVSNVLAQPASSHAIDLSWINNSATATEFIIERSDNGGATFQELPTRPSSSPFRDETVGLATTYQYKITAANATTTSMPSLPVEASTFPASATGDLSMQSSGIDRVDLTWSPVSGATEYRVEASFDGISFDPIEAASYGSSVTNASFVRMEPGDRLYARIAAYDGAELLGRSTVAGATTHLAVPNTPGLVRATIVGDQVTITWAVADELEDYFILERQTDGQPFDHFVRVDARSEGFTEAVPDPSRTYGYRIKAGNYVGDSAYSPVSVAAPPSAPEGEPELGHQDILVSFFGADPGAADSDGNRWFLEEQIHRELLDAHGYIALGPNERPYRDFNGPNAFRDLLAAMDRAEPFGRITQAEVASTTIRLLGWSLGAVEAVYFSQQLTDTRGLAGSFFWQSGRSLDVEVPVESMVLLDPVIDGLAPLTMRYIRGPVRTNVQELNNFWQRRGGISTIRTYVLGTYNTQFPIEVQLDPPATYTSQIAGVELRGRRIPFQEGVVERQIRIDTDPDYVNQEEVHDYIRDPQRFDGVLLGRDVNHSTLVWYQGPEAVQLLAP